MKDPRDVILAPVVSEKSYASLDHGVYTFLVHPRASKTEIKDAVQRIFDVRVVRVNTLWRQGKKKRTRATVGTRNSQKRAIVTLAEGDSITIFNPK
ncbi:MAG: 50S ribosomal protein L23 [Actinomycetota bacterium]